MKKAFLILSLVLGLCAGSYAQLFNRDGRAISDGSKEPVIGMDHGAEGDGDANTPLSGGALLLIGFGAAYALSKKNKKD